MKTLSIILAFLATLSGVVALQSNEYLPQYQRARVVIANNSSDTVIDSAIIVLPGGGEQISRKRIKPGDFLITNWPASGAAVAVGYWSGGEYFGLLDK